VGGITAGAIQKHRHKSSIKHGSTAWVSLLRRIKEGTLLPSQSGANKKGSPTTFVGEP